MAAGCGAADAVFATSDLAEFILLNRVGPFTFVQVSGVNRALYQLCRYSLPLLRAVALYSDGKLTRTKFAGLLGLNWRDVSDYPCVRLNNYYLYDRTSIEAVLAATSDPMAALRERQRARAAERALLTWRAPRQGGQPFRPAGYPSFHEGPFAPRRRRRDWELEDYFHHARAKRQ